MNITYRTLLTNFSTKIGKTLGVHVKNERKHAPGKHKEKLEKLLGNGQKTWQLTEVQGERMETKRRLLIRRWWCSGLHAEDERMMKWWLLVWLMNIGFCFAVAGILGTGKQQMHHFIYNKNIYYICVYIFFIFESLLARQCCAFPISGKFC